MQILNIPLTPGMSFRKTTYGDIQVMTPSGGIGLSQGVSWAFPNVKVLRTIQGLKLVLGSPDYTGRVNQTEYEDRELWEMHKFGNLCQEVLQYGSDFDGDVVPPRWGPMIQSGTRGGRSSAPSLDSLFERWRYHQFSTTDTSPADQTTNIRSLPLSDLFSGQQSLEPRSQGVRPRRQHW